MGRNLRTQCAQLGKSEPCARLLKFGKLDLGCDPGGDLVGYLNRCWTGRRAYRCERPNYLLAYDNGNDDSAPDRTLGCLAGDVTRLKDQAPTVFEDLMGRNENAVLVVFVTTVPAQHLGIARERDRCVRKE